MTQELLTPINTTYSTIPLVKKSITISTDIHSIEYKTGELTSILTRIQSIPQTDTEDYEKTLVDLTRHLESIPSIICNTNKPSPISSYISLFIASYNTLQSLFITKESRPLLSDILSNTLYSTNTRLFIYNTLVRLNNQSLHSVTLHYIQSVMSLYHTSPLLPFISPYDSSTNDSLLRDYFNNIIRVEDEVDTICNELCVIITTQTLSPKVIPSLAFLVEKIARLGYMDGLCSLLFQSMAEIPSELFKDILMELLLYLPKHSIDRLISGLLVKMGGRVQGLGGM